MPQPSITEICLKIMYLKFHSNFPGVNELTMPVNGVTIVLCWGIDLMFKFSYYIYRKTSNINRTLVGNKIVDNSDVVGASPVGAAPTTSSSST